MTTKFDSNVEDFREWLVSTGLTKRVAGDYLSRCRRIQRVFNVDLYEAVSKETDYIDLLIRIWRYAESNTNSQKAKHALNRSLRAACKKYAEFKFPKKSKKYRPLHFGRQKNIRLTLN